MEEPKLNKQECVHCVVIIPTNDSLAFSFFVPLPHFKSTLDSSTMYGVSFQSFIFGSICHVFQHILYS